VSSFAWHAKLWSVPHFCCCCCILHL
jgi:hypothetical protein